MISFCKTISQRALRQSNVVLLQRGTRQGMAGLQGLQILPLKETGQTILQSIYVIGETIDKHISNTLC